MIDRNINLYDDELLLPGFALDYVSSLPLRLECCSMKTSFFLYFLGVLWQYASHPSDVTSILRQITLLCWPPLGRGKEQYRLAPPSKDIKLSSFYVLLIFLLFTENIFFLLSLILIFSIDCICLNK